MCDKNYRDEQLMLNGAPGQEVTTDSDADVCEWERFYDKTTNVHRYIDSCREKRTNISPVEDVKYCPYCGKPITIKGE